MKENEVPKIPYSILAYVTNSSKRTIRAVQSGERKDCRRIRSSEKKIEDFLEKLRESNQN